MIPDAVARQFDMLGEAFVKGKATLIMGAFADGNPAYVVCGELGPESYLPLAIIPVVAIADIVRPPSGAVVTDRAAPPIPADEAVLPHTCDPFNPSKPCAACALEMLRHQPGGTR